MMQTTGYNGYAMIVAFVALANSGAVFAAWLLQVVAIQTYLFWAFLFVILFFLTVNWISGHGRPQIGKTELGMLALINVTTVANWGAYFFALMYIEPAVVTAVLCGIGPITIVAFKILSRNDQVTHHAAVSSIATLLGTTILVWATITGKSGIPMTDTGQLGFGLLAAVLAGTMQAATILNVKKLGDRGWSSQQIMAHRFYLLCICSFFWAGATARLFDLTLAQGGMLIVLAAYAVALPLWLLQRGIIRTDPTIASVILALGPIVTFLTQFADTRVTLSMFTAVGCAVIVSATAYGVLKDAATPLPAGSKAQPGNAAATKSACSFQFKTKGRL